MTSLLRPTARGAFALALAAALIVRPAAARAQSVAEPPRGAAALAQLVDGLGMTARVLVVGAHPDDEDTRLIAYLARGRHAETAYLSLTRGDGGQNLIGNELGEALGAIRTEELLAARRLDGGRQYFTRAFDFGFSKSAEETFRHWPRDTVLGDVVRVVRAFRPQVMIAIFSGTRADGHGQHEASGLLARAAYDAAGDTVRFPVRAFGPAWTVDKFYRNTSYRGAETATLRYNAGAYDPVLGRSYTELAAISRTQHKSQGQGGVERKGVSIVSMRREATRVNAGTPPNAERDLFDGIDTTVARVRGGAAGAAAVESLGRTLAAVRTAYDAHDLARSVGPLARARAALDSARCGHTPCTGRAPARGEADADATLRVLARQVDDALALASGVLVEADVGRELAVAGDSVPVTVTVYNRGSAPIQLSQVAVRAAWLGYAGQAHADCCVVRPDSAFRWVAALQSTGMPLPGAPLRATQPWWLRTPRNGDLFDVPLGTLDEATRAAGATADVDVEVMLRPAGPMAVQGTTFVAHAPLVFRYADPVRGEVRRPAAAVPAVSVTLDRAVQYARANAPLDRVLRVHLRSASTSARPVTVRLELPTGLTADSAARTVTLAGYDAGATLAFRLRGTLRPGRHLVRAVAERNGERFAAGYQLVDYEHIRPQRLYRPAEVALEAVDVLLPPRAAVAYVPGVSDNVAPALADLGLAVTVLDPAALGTADLSRFTHVVVGPRAYEANPALLANNARLLDWTRAGGTMLVQYGQYEMTRPGVMPYPITLGRPAGRVTIEEAPVTVLDPAARVLTVPNRLTAADWQGWVQERSTYMPQSADPHYRTAVALNDPGEPPNPNGILVAPVGRGTYVYVTLALFRQLPAGVPGAARLVANLLSARAEPTAAAAAGR